ncbi:MAG: PAS domain S-box protein [Ignavibacteriales bacterium]|nr:PAS domain S-box protein [Ignavibacteriales bacterium]
MIISGNDSSAHIAPGMEFPILELLPVGIVILNAEMKPAYMNQNLLRFNLFTPQNFDENGFPEIPLREFITPDEEKSLVEGYAVEKSLRINKAIDGSEISLILKAMPILNEGLFNGIVLLIEDIKLPEDQTQRSGKLIENYFENILNRIWSLFMLVSGDGKILLLGGKKIKHFIKKSNTKPESLYEIFLPDYEHKIISSFKGAILKKQTEEIILEFPKADDKEAEYYECAIAPIPSDRIKSGLAFVSIREITTFLKMIENYQRELSELQQYYKFTQEIAESVFVFNRQGKIVFWNKASEKVFKLRRSEVFGKQAQRVFPFLTDEKVDQINKQSLEEDSHGFETLVPLIDGENRMIGFQCYTVTEEDNLYYIMIANDYTASREGEQAVKSLLTLMTSFFKGHANPGMLLSADGKILIKNEAFNRVFSERIRDNSDPYLVDLLDTSFVVNSDITFHGLSKENSQALEIPFSVSGGKNLFFLCTINRIPDSENELKFICTLQDITDKKKATEELELLNSVFSFSNDGIAVEKDNTFLLVNDAFSRLFGYESREELIGENWSKIVAMEELNRIKEYGEKRSKSEEVPSRYDFFALRKDGSRFSAEISVTKFLLSKEQYFVIVARDITEIKRSQQVIKESEEKYRSITENIDDFFWTAELINDVMKPVFYTSSVEKITGYTQNDFLNDSRFFFKIIYPDDFSVVKEKLKRFYSNYYKRSEELDFRIVHSSGNVVWIRNKINVLRDRKGKVLKVFGLVSDISLQKKAEEERALSAQNLQKLNETKDKFISIISHDLRTPFSSILGFTDLLLNEDDLTPEEARQYIQYIQESSHNMLSLVNSLLDWTRIQTGRVPFEPKHVNLREFVNSVFGGLHGVAMKKDVDLLNEVAEDTVLFIDQSLTMQVFNNLLSNALKFTPGGGAITIAARQSAQPRFMEILVSDTGMGIKKENMNKIFNVDAKFTTEGTSGEKGTGLGLSLVKEIVEKHGGSISVESEYGMGTTFRFTLPKASATILLIDDSNTDRILYSKILKSIVADYEILLAKNGREGLDILKAHSPALVITDHAMPVMDGYQFIAEFRRLKMSGKPPVIVLSGDIGKNEQMMYADMGVEHVFTKPVNLASFKAAIEKALSQIPK